MSDEFGMSAFGFLEFLQRQIASGLGIRETLL
jgi:hypothetical protein